jgi:hypothetical protein
MNSSDLDETRPHHIKLSQTMHPFTHLPSMKSMTAMVSLSVPWRYRSTILVIVCSLRLRQRRSPDVHRNARFSSSFTFPLLRTACAWVESEKDLKCEKEARLWAHSGKSSQGRRKRGSLCYDKYIRIRGVYLQRNTYYVDVFCFIKTELSE